MRLNRAVSPLIFALIVFLNINAFTLFADCASSDGNGDGLPKKPRPSGLAKLLSGLGGFGFRPKSSPKGGRDDVTKPSVIPQPEEVKEGDIGDQKTPDHTPPSPIPFDESHDSRPEEHEHASDSSSESGPVRAEVVDIQTVPSDVADVLDVSESSKKETASVIIPTVSGPDPHPSIGVISGIYADAVFRNTFNDHWQNVFSPESVYYPLIKLDLDKSTLIGDSKVLEAILSRYEAFFNSHIGSLNMQLGISRNCVDLSESDILYLEAFSYFVNVLTGTRISDDEICLLYSKSKSRGSGFHADVDDYLTTNKNVVLNRDLLNSIHLTSLNYKAAKSFKSSDLTVYGIKRLLNDNFELASASNCDDDQIIFSMAVSILSDAYRLDLGSVSRVGVRGICEILKNYRGFTTLVYELVLDSYFRRGLQNFDDLPFEAFIIKDNLERCYKQLSDQFLSYFMKYDLNAVQILSRTMDSKVDVKDVIGDVRESADDGAIKTSDRFIEPGFPIPEIPGPPSRKGLGRIPVPPSDSELFLPSRASKTLYFGYGESYPTRPEVLPEKQKGREFVKELVTHISPRDYETQFLYGSSQFTGPKLTYFKRLSEREFLHQKKLKHMKEEEKRLESRRKKKMSLGYRDLSDFREDSVSFDETPVSSEISEEPSPIPAVAAKEEIPSRFGEKLHTLISKSNRSVYKQPSKYGPFRHELDYATLKPTKKYDSVGYPFRRSGGRGGRYTDESTSDESSDESSDRTIGISEDSAQGDSHIGDSDVEGISRRMEALSLEDRVPKKEVELDFLTTESAAKEIPLKCRELSRSQQKRALGLFRVLKYLYSGSTSKWYITAFCRAVYFAERDICIEKGVKDLDIKKMASECYTSLKSASFISSNPALSRIARQVCYTYYKKRGASVCN
ncbi:hypothetical protein FG386_001016 [Cryptosporidium ryanae]|uniref:uncharacterized protein n=1 Tax=Cryptosporidium ryanae TaxID=515981 RepID=UPI00351A2367|nr:hypothetical protein FG386_001016 [Cryptosporidium ryanae]